MRVIGLGAGGHAKVVIEILRVRQDIEVIGLLDPDESLWTQEVCGVPVIGDDDKLAEVYASGVRHAFIGLGTTGDAGPRRRLYELAVAAGLDVIRVVHPSAVVSPSARFGQGATILAGAVVNADAALGDDVIVNSGAVVEHDCVIGDHVHIATGALLGGGVRVGTGAHIGIGACVRQAISIGERAVVGAGAAVVKDVPRDTLVVGVPAEPAG